MFPILKHLGCSFVYSFFQLLSASLTYIFCSWLKLSVTKFCKFLKKSNYAWVTYIPSPNFLWVKYLNITVATYSLQMIMIFRDIYFVLQTRRTRVHHCQCPEKNKKQRKTIPAKITSVCYFSFCLQMFFFFSSEGRTVCLYFIIISITLIKISSFIILKEENLFYLFHFYYLPQNHYLFPYLTH